MQRFQNNSHHHISIIGAGNVSWHLAQALKASGCIIHEIFSRSVSHAEMLASQLYETHGVSHLDFSESKAKIFIIAVSDDAIESVVSKLILPPNSILVHTSGSQPMSALMQEKTPHIGVFYPLQTFSKEKPVDFSQIPICLEAAQKEDLPILQQLAGSISRDVRIIGSSERAVLHVAAVFASNFANHLLGMAGHILAEHQIRLDILQPLLTETLQKAFEIGPQKAQTGPAVRGDVATINRHLELLKNKKDYAELYKLLSQHIIENT